MDRTDEDRVTGLRRKYQVLRHDGRDGAGQKHEGCEYFVLDLTHDPAARVAAMAYARSVGAEQPQLLMDLVSQVDRLGGVPTPKYPPAA